MIWWSVWCIGIVLAILFFYLAYIKYPPYEVRTLWQAVIVIGTGLLAMGCLIVSNAFSPSPEVLQCTTTVN